MASIDKKLVIIPAEADAVRLIFRRYLELGSIRCLVEDLDHRGIRTRQQILSTGKSRGGIRFGVGGLAQLLRNRFYIGEVVYKGAIHPGEQEPILDRALFEAVQARLASGASARQLSLRASPSILAGRIFDDRGNRMTPSHTNKHGARYRYYVSHAILQNRKTEAGSVHRINAPELEALVTEAVRTHHLGQPNDGTPTAETKRDLIRQYVERIVVKAQSIDLHLFNEEGHGAEQHARDTAASESPIQRKVISLPWNKPSTVSTKGILHSPSPCPTMSTDERDVLLTAIAKARAWIADLVEGRATSFADIARHAGKVERHIRLLAPLAFVSPQTIAHIFEGTAPSIAVTGLAKQTPHYWNQRRAS